MSLFDDIDFLLSASRICFGIAVAAAILAIALFFLLDIREIFMIETGRAQRKTVEEMHERNLRTGKLRDDTESDLHNKAGSSNRSADAVNKADTGGSVRQRSDFQQRTLSVDGDKAGRVTEAYDDMAAQSGVNRQLSDWKKGNVSLKEEDREPRKQLGGAMTPGIPFYIKEKTIIIHTNEKIPM